jgi:hypothetical protein
MAKLRDFWSNDIIFLTEGRRSEKQQELLQELMLAPKISDPKTLELYKNCRNAQFPICLERALSSIFGDYDLVMFLAKKGTRYPEPRRESIRVEDVWDGAIDFLAGLETQLGKDVAAVVESKTIEIMKEMKCDLCPFYKMEVSRNGNFDSQGV